MKIVGHRGAEGYAPENTLLSFEKAIELGCDRAELDVRLSKDGEIFVMHDAAVDRTTDGHGLVAEMTGDELKNLNCPSGQKIPTLQEAIDVCKGKIDLQIELKAGEGLAEKVNGLITKTRSILKSSFPRLN
jgi:glycerophosphoryl diester phosphodiesterase